MAAYREQDALQQQILQVRESLHCDLRFFFKKKHKRLCVSLATGQ